MLLLPRNISVMHKRYAFLLLLFFTSLSSWATHQRAAEITYRWIGANTYEFTLTCYTFSPSLAGAQRDSLLLQWGDGSQSMVPRVVYQDLGDDYTLNVYKALHHFSSAGTYVISMEDPNRNYGVINVPNSVAVPMYIESELVINPYLGYNNSVQLLNPPVDKGCVGKLFLHNPSAYDPDGDSLSFRLVNCKGLDGEDIPGYAFPQASNCFTMDAITGELHWDSPVLQGEYNVAFIVEEWRNGVKIGSVIRDMQILVAACNNNLPEIQCLDDTCVAAGSRLVFQVSASDPDGDQVALTAFGAPFEVPMNPAYMEPENPQGQNPEADFIWDCDCRNIRKTPYQVVFHARDNAVPVNLTNVKTVSISVIGPPVANFAAVSEGTSAHLSWNPYLCSNAEALRVYRKIGMDAEEPAPCEMGVGVGYQLIADFLPSQTTEFTDNNHGAGLQQGVTYCYRMVAVFHDGVEGKAGEKACVMLANDAPLMTHVTNDSVDLTLGYVVVAWTAPQDIDSSQYAAPYSYRLKRLSGGSETVVFSGAATQTSYKDTGWNLNQQQQVAYKVELHDANQQLMGESPQVPPVRIEAVPGDGRLTLNWTHDVPWIIDKSELFRQQGDGFVRLVTTSLSTYTDAGLENGTEYRYYVRTWGRYSIPEVQHPLINYSAVIAATPSDNTPPQPLRLQVVPDCETLENELIWNRPIDDDLAGYQIYYTASVTAGFTLLDLQPQFGDTSVRHIGLDDVAGCYYIRAYDMDGNLSVPSDTVCIDYDACPIYELPNVFTPNGDGYNDVFRPIHVRKAAIDHFTIHIFNRWGNIVFETSQPMIEWDGRDRHSRLPCAPGTYFYVCQITYTGLTGQKELRLQGSIAIVQ